MILEKIRTSLSSGSARTILVKKNILGNFAIKGISVLISLLYVPITLNYLNPTRYGIWMTLTSIVAWMSIFDIGLGNGLRNKLAEALAIGDTNKGKKFVSTAYFMLTSIVISVLVLFYIVNYWIDWTIVLNTPNSYSEELNSLVVIVSLMFGLRFVLKIITTVFVADQLPAIGSIFDVLGNAAGLLIVWVLTQLEKSSLITFGWATMLTPVIIYLCASIIFYNGKYSFLKPSFKQIDFSYAKELTSLGIQFFVIQIAVLVIFQTSNILIAQFFSPAEVTPYNIVFKYFGVLTMVWGIIMTPLWSAFTHAKATHDVDWMRRTIIKLNKLMGIAVLVLLLMAFLCQYIIGIWTNKQIEVNVVMVWIFAFYTFISIWNNIYAFFLNGIGKIRVQIYTSIVASLLHVPMAYVLVNYFRMGSEGVVLSMAISLSFFAIAGPIQSFNILKSWKRI